MGGEPSGDRDEATVARGGRRAPATSSTCRSRTRGAAVRGAWRGWLFDDIYLRGEEYPGFATMRLILLDLPDGGSVLIAIDEERLEPRCRS